MVERIEHYRLSLNQAYMAAAMSAAMMFVMQHGLSTQSIVIYTAIFIFAVLAIRTQFFVTDRQYVKEMIQHHSMALLTSRPRIVRTNNPRILDLAKGIIHTQEKEIALMAMLE